MICKKKNEQKAIFDESEKIAALYGYRNPLAKIDAVIDFELFRKELEMLTEYKTRDPKKGGRQAYDVVLMMKRFII